MKQIQLTQGKVALVDDEDFDRINNNSWCFLQGRAVRTGKKNEGKSKKAILMHREVLNYFGELDIDHINGDATDNRKENLRICTRSENIRNSKLSSSSSSGYKGVSVCTNYGWRAQIQCDGKVYNLGEYKTAEKAAIAYDIAAKKYFGEYARLNFPNN